MFQQLFRGVLGEEVKDVSQGEAVLLGEGDVDAVVGGGGLELEVEAATEAFAESEAEGFVDAATEGSVQDELHAAPIVEEALSDDCGLGGDGPESGAAGDDIGYELSGTTFTDAAFFDEPSDGGVYFGIGGRDVAGDDVGGAGRDLFAEFADAIGENRGALRGFTEPERQCRWRAVRVFYEDTADRFDTLDAPAGVAEEDDVAGRGVDGEVLVERGYLQTLRLEDDIVKICFGNGSAIGDCDHAGAAARMEMMLDAVTEEVRAITAAGGFDAFGEEGQEFVEGFAGEVAIGVGAMEGVVEGVLFPWFGSAGRDDLLHEYVGGLRRDL